MSPTTQKLKEQLQTLSENSFKEDMNNLLNEMKENKTKCLSNYQENTNMWRNEMVRTIQDLETELSKGTGIVNGTQTKIEMEERGSVIQLQNMGVRNRTSRMDQINIE